MKTLEALDKILKGKTLKPKTVNNYKNAFRLLAEFSEELPEHPALINEFIVSIKDRYRDVSYSLWWAVIRSGYKYLNEMYDIPFIFSKLRRPKVLKRPRRYFTIPETLAIISACKTDKQRALIMTIIDSTCRIGELARLQLKDVADNHILIAGLSDAKTGAHHSRLDTRICEVLKTLVHEPNDYVFGTNGKAIKPNDLAKQVTIIIKRAGITGEKLGAHTLRHTSASLVARATKSPLAVKAILSHADIATSMLYIHDAEESIAQETSPLQILGEQVSNTAETKRMNQLLLTDGNQDTDQIEYDNEITQQLFPIPGGSTTIRPKLDNKDLELIRLAFLHYYNTVDYNDTIGQMKTLYNRILRKVKATNVHIS